MLVGKARSKDELDIKKIIIISAKNRLNES